MEVELNSDKLVDYPYSSANDGVFDFNDAQVEDFINDLTLGSPTCYLVSGYRGVGKTSLIKKVDAEISKYEQVTFVYTSFARYESKTHLIRKLIRELYLKVAKTEKYKKLSTPEEKKFVSSFDILYQQTFKEISEITDNSSNREFTITSEFSLTDALKTVGKQLAPLLALIPWYVAVALNKSLTWLIEWCVPILAIGWTVVNALNIQISRITKNQSLKGVYTKTLFDDEIAGTLFLDILSQLKGLGFKVVFVLDELDKVSLKDLDLLISEMKPYLVCGYSDFIVVGGQNLYYKFDVDDNIDDSVLSSLFSKVYHVPITSSVILRDLFYNQIVKKTSFDKLTDDDKKNLDVQLDYLIFSSRLIPRRFITRLRQQIVWKNKQAYFVDRTLPALPERYRRIINTIDKIDDTKIEAEYPAAIRDYIVMKMYLQCGALFAPNRSINKKTFVNG